MSDRHRNPRPRRAPRRALARRWIVVIVAATTVAAIGIGGAIMIAPGIVRPRGGVERIRALAQVRQITQAWQVWVRNHPVGPGEDADGASSDWTAADGPVLRDLVDAQYLDAATLRSPFGDGTDDYGVNERRAGFIDPARAATTILLYDRAMAEAGEAEIAVAFRDGTVRLVGAAEFGRLEALPENAGLR